MLLLLFCGWGLLDQGGSGGSGVIGEVGRGGGGTLEGRLLLGRWGAGLVFLGQCFTCVGANKGGCEGLEDMYGGLGVSGG